MMWPLFYQLSNVGALLKFRRAFVPKLYATGRQCLNPRVGVRVKVRARARARARAMVDGT